MPINFNFQNVKVADFHKFLIHISLLYIIKNKQAHNAFLEDLRTIDFERLMV